MERVVLLDEAGHAVGVADKATVHTTDTPLHLAFSCYAMNSSGELLLTQRAHGKRTWPGVWTNSCCGHPGPGEDLVDSVRRRLREELGLVVGRVDLVLPRFRYRAVMANGIVENEMCPVFVARTDAEPRPDPAEVAAYRWMSWTAVSDQVLSGELAVSPWCAEQVRELVALGAEPRSWPVGRRRDLPAAALG
ncbi:isopentenyl-diphosphate delta-isomerase [Amycolatopsis arida]|uniref:Isopentenyl-diphosphate Delta-isomerase n=1 Tax=Amycolatopsis arida TaxID=587909 RepID=A0A1I5LVS7_9PSEU|nr:isopentenyl-diphosphate Delta-isomerase [Amycolatopsis arida]TDX93868.1 isopentenyl-diphosphate delta-isomerase [Amycolatopsis arida]SFP01365.1 isopentenyl-diphosphate delta-isomerase [Amycolatopsis arida]